MSMVKKIRALRPLRFPLLAAAVLALAGCTSSSNVQSGLNLVDTSGNHPAGWMAGSGPSLHSRQATNAFMNDGNIDICTPCHGGDLKGGISRTDCLATCHHSAKFAQFVNWASPAVHGFSAKSAPGSASFFSCRICHGVNFAGGPSGRACFGCHGVNAPHPAKPWRTSGGTNHDNTNPLNAPVCAACHFPGSPNNPAGHPPTPAPAGTPPGCFNSTLCHGVPAAPHILGAAWRDPAVGGASFHGLTAKQDLVFCQGCHGTPGTILFEGGATVTKCSTCHTAAKAHPTTWFAAPSPFPGYVASHRDSGNRSVACAICHNVTGPGAGPAPGAPSCFSASFTNADGVAASCHSNGPGAPNHAVPFVDNTHFQATQATFASNCSNCHAVTGTSPVSAAPLCAVCHTAGSPLTLTNCASCHANPPSGGAGAVYPNIAGAHAKHIALNSAGTPISCDTCHNGLGTNTLNHYNRANGRPGKGGRVPPGDVAFVAAYDAKSGASFFDNTLSVLGCSNVRCHGGQVTPNWQTGALNVNTQCTSCHKGSTTAPSQYNDYVVKGQQGDHAFHIINQALSCTNCHSAAKLADPNVGKHFLNLSTSAFDVAPAVTVGGAGTNVNSYNGATRSCSPSCHETQTFP